MGCMGYRGWITIRRLAEQGRPSAVRLGVLTLAAALALHVPLPAALGAAVPRAYLSLVASLGCAPIAGESYSSAVADGPHPGLPAIAHPDLNLAVRGHVASSAPAGLVDYGGAADERAPQLEGLCAAGPPSFSAAYQVLDWDWDAMCCGHPISDPPVTALALRTRHGEMLRVPASGYSIGEGWEVLVLYASAERITLKYTREDNVVYGYTLHVEGVCVEPRLVSLYETCNAEGRGRLPALREQQAFGRARGDQVVVAIRDHGRFLDPRSRKDWWRGY